MSFKDSTKNTIKDTAQEILGILESVRQSHQPEDSYLSLKQLDETIKRLKEEKFVLVVLGQFKRGKSSLLNALLGRELLPSGVIPLTSIITEISYSEKEEAIVCFQQGQEKTISLDSLYLYITETENPSNIKGVSKAVLRIDSAFLQKGVILVDTPGIGSTLLHNTAEAYDFLPLADAVIFVLSSDPPVSQVELEFLSEITRHVRKIFFVLNKTDYFNGEELKEAHRFCRSVIEDFTQARIDLFPLSARLGLKGKLENDEQLQKASGLKEFEEILTSYLLNEKGTEALVSACRRGKNSIERLLNNRLLAIMASQLPLENLQEKISVFETKTTEILQQKEDHEILFNASMAKLRRSIEKDLEDAKYEAIKTVSAKIKAHYQETEKMPVLKGFNTLNSYSQQYIVEFYDNWRKVEDVKINEEYQAILKRYAVSINKMTNEILDLTRDLFEVELNPASKENILAPSFDFYYKFRENIEFYNLHPLAIFSLLPKIISLPYFRKLNLEGTKEDVDRSSGRIRVDYVERINKSAKEFRNALTQEYTSTLQTLKDILEHSVNLKSSQDKEVTLFKERLEKEVQELKKHLDRLLELENDLVMEFTATTASAVDNSF